MARSDGTLAAAVRAAPDDARDLDAVDIEVTASHGIVTLSGMVPNRVEKLLARTVAADVPGALGVRDELTCPAPLLGWRSSDPEIASHAAARPREAGLPEFEVAVEFHRARLTGTTASGERRRIARHLVATTPGVHFVVDGCEVGTKDPVASPPRSARVGP